MSKTPNVKSAAAVAGAAPCSVERTHRSVIEHKLLTALEDENCVAALLSKRDLDDMISALYGFEDMGHDRPRKKRCKELADSMSQLRREAFPPNVELSDRRENNQR